MLTSVEMAINFFKPILPGRRGFLDTASLHHHHHHHHHYFIIYYYYNYSKRSHSNQQSAVSNQLLHYRPWSLAIHQHPAAWQVVLYDYLHFNEREGLKGSRHD